MKALDGQHVTGDAVLIVGNSGGTNIGESLVRAASQLGLRVGFVDALRAMDAPVWVRRANWYLRGRRPTWLRRSSSQVVEQVQTQRPQWLLTTGFAPCTRRDLERIGRTGVVRINYMTDDPFNPSVRAPWFLAALPEYDYVFSARRANMDDVRGLGCRRVMYQPFGYDPAHQYPEASADPDRRGDSCDVLFVGGGDSDRVPYIATLIEHGFRVGLYGDYWERFSATRACTRGHADPGTVRRATATAKICLCIVRKANRDGNTMRSFEIPATSGCMLAEDTGEHRDIFGADGDAVVYFRSLSDMVRKAGWLLEHPEERTRLAAAAHALVTRGGHSYRDRLVAMLAGHEFTPATAAPHTGARIQSAVE
ncbi:MAG TPA: glycosyltransferase [Candidatus Acidoferrum sp.]|nr:glycosyltransferase [Candidatus Acidoferrum sp.]